MEKNNDNKDIYAVNKKIYLQQMIPTLLTITGLGVSFHAVKFVLNGRIGLALLAVFAAIIFDMLDGRVARILKASSKIGSELDSLSDMVSFGAVPAIISYIVYIDQFPRIGWLACTFYLICACLRLARFNVNSVEGEEVANNFEGMPVPAAAAVLQMPIMFMYAFFDNPDFNKFTAFVGIILLIFLGLIMISKVPTPSFKKLKINKAVLTLTVVSITTLTIVFINYTWQVGFILSFSYFSYICYCIYIYSVNHGKQSSQKQKT